MIFIDSQAVTADGTEVLVSELLSWIWEEEAVLAVIGGRIKSDGGTVTPGTTAGRVRGGRPA